MIRRPAATISLVAGAVLVAGVVAFVTNDGSEPEVAMPAGTDATPVPEPENGPPDALVEGVEGQQDDIASPTDPGGLMSMWSRGGLGADVATQASALPDVVAATFVRNETAGLIGSRDADGRPVDVLADGFRIPVSVVAVDPVSYAATIASAETGAILAELDPGDVLLSQAAADLRGVGVGGEIDLQGRMGLRIVGIVADGVVGRAEMVLHAADADAIGIPAHGAVVLRHTAPTAAATETLAAALETLAPADAPARVVEVGGGTDRQIAPLVLALVEIKERFGEFAYRPRSGVRDIDIEQGFLDEHIVTVEVPVLGAVRCHRGIVDDLRAALDEIVTSGLADHIDPARYGGCHHPRRINPARDRLSSHAWGIAIDINVDLSLPGLGPVPPEAMIEIFGRHGFRWGGDFIQPDHHHFEWIGAEALHRPPP